MLIGPWSGWQSRVSDKFEKNSASFEDLLGISEQYKFWNNHKKIEEIISGMPFSSEFIGVLREDLDKIVCLEGHHRAIAFALVKKLGRQFDFRINTTIALAALSKDEVYLLDEMLNRGSSRDPQK